MRGILGYPPLVVRNPGLGGLLCGEARYHRRETSGHLNLNSKGQILLRNDPKGSFGMRMFFRHALYMGTCYAKAKCLPGPNAAFSASVKADRSRVQCPPAVCCEDQPVVPLRHSRRDINPEVVMLLELGPMRRALTSC